MLVWYLGVQHKFNCRNQLLKRKLVNWNRWRAYASGVDSFSPKWLVAKERNDGCRALQYQQKLYRVVKKVK